MINGVLYATGGNDGTSATDKVEAFTPDCAGSPGPQGPPGPAGPQGGPQGIPGISGLQYITGPFVHIGKSSTDTATASCPAGKKVIGGGYTTTVPNPSSASPSALQIFSSGPSGTSAWSVSATNTSSGAGNLGLRLTAYAICAVVQ
jgi:hypothetical protein